MSDSQADLETASVFLRSALHILEDGPLSARWMPASSAIVRAIRAVEALRIGGDYEPVRDSPALPALGTIVLYHLTAQDAAAVNRRRADAARMMEAHRVLKTGAQVHIGTTAMIGALYPMIVVSFPHRGAVGGQVLLDGNDVLWIPAAEHGDALGQWCERAV